MATVAVPPTPWTIKEKIEWILAELASRDDAG